MKVGAAARVVAARSDWAQFENGTPLAEEDDGRSTSENARVPAARSSGMQIVLYL